MVLAYLFWGGAVAVAAFLLGRLKRRLRKWLKAPQGEVSHTPCPTE